VPCRKPLVSVVRLAGSWQGGKTRIEPCRCDLPGHICTPGLLVSMYSLLRGVAADGRDAPSEEEIEECLARNLW
jgi:hypothetical protein